MSDYSSWLYRRSITLNTTSGGANIATSQSNFPVLLRFTSSNFTFANADTNGEDIRFTAEDGTTDLYFEIERWDSANSLGEIWVRVPTVTGNSTTTIKMFYKKSGQSSASDGANTFSGATGVYHMETDTASGADSTGLNDPSLISGQAVQDGIIGKCLYSTDGDDYQIANTAHSLWINSAFSLSMWVKWYDLTGSGAGGLCSNESYTVSGFRFGVDGSDYLQFWTDESGGGVRVTSYDAPGGPIQMATGTWYHLAVTWNGGTARLYINGAQVDSDNTGAIIDNTITMKLMDAIGGTLDFKGWMDEVRFAKSTWAADWIKCCYENQQATNTLATVGAETIGTIFEHDIQAGIQTGILRGINSRP